MRLIVLLASCTLALCLGLPGAAATIPAPGCSDHRFQQPDAGLQEELWGFRALSATYCVDEEGAWNEPPQQGWDGGSWFTHGCYDEGTCYDFWLFGEEGAFQVISTDDGIRHRGYLGHDPYEVPWADLALGYDVCVDWSAGANATCEGGQVYAARASAFVPDRVGLHHYLRDRAVGVESELHPLDERSDEDLTELDAGIEGPWSDLLPNRARAGFDGSASASFEHDPSAEGACSVPRLWTDTSVDTPCFGPDPIGNVLDGTG